MKVLPSEYILLACLALGALIGCARAPSNHIESERVDSVVAYFMPVYRSYYSSVSAGDVLKEGYRQAMYSRDSIAWLVDRLSILLEADSTRKISRDYRGVMLLSSSDGTLDTVYFDGSMQMYINGQLFAPDSSIGMHYCRNYIIDSSGRKRLVPITQWLF